MAPENCTVRSRVGDTMAVHFIVYIDESSAVGDKGKMIDNSASRQPFMFELGRGDKALKG